MSFWNAFLSQSTNPLRGIFAFLLLTLGFWMLFPKCGIRRVWALVPVLRYYKLAQAADREDAGFIFAVSLFISRVMLFSFDYLKMENDLQILAFLAVLIFVGLFAAIYEIRVYAGICRTFNRSRLWVLVWLFFNNITPLIWGISRKFHPPYYEENPEVQAAPESGIRVEEMAQGLTVNLTKRTVRNFLERKTLLKDIHLNLCPGRMVLLLGGSGAGKTTLINAVIGYEKADASISLNEQDVYREYDRMIYEIALVPQQDLIRYNDTVLRTITDAAVLRLPESVTRSERTKRVNEVLDIFGLTSVKNSQVEKLSGGQRKRLSIAMEYISDPSLFVLDEPDSGLDGVLARDLMARLQKIARQGKIVIVITHSPDRVAEFFDDIIVLAKDADGTGRLVFFGSIEESLDFFGKERLEDIVKCINRPDEGGEGRADEMIAKFAEVQHGKE